MKQIEKFSTPVCNELQAELEKALATVSAKFGVTIQFRGGKYTDVDFNPKIVISLKNAPTYNKKYEGSLAVLGLPENTIGRSFKTSYGKTMTVIDINNRATKMPIICKCTEDNKNYKFDAESVKRYLK